MSNVVWTNAESDEDEEILQDKTTYKFVASNTPAFKEEEKPKFEFEPKFEFKPEKEPKKEPKFEFKPEKELKKEPKFEFEAKKEEEEETEEETEQEEHDFEVDSSDDDDINEEDENIAFPNQPQSEKEVLLEFSTICSNYLKRLPQHINYIYQKRDEANSMAALVSVNIQDEKTRRSFNINARKKIDTHHRGNL